MAKTVVNIDKSELNNSNKIKKKYSNEFLLDYLMELARQLGKTPSEKDIKRAGKLSAGLYSIRFGSFSKAQEKAGLEPNKKLSARRYPDELLLSQLIELSKQLGKTPTARDVIKAGKISYNEYFKNFGSFSKAQKAAGLIPNKQGKQKKQL
jgi:hypothetical protein